MSPAHGISLFAWAVVVCCTVGVGSAANCDVSYPPSNNPYYKAFCGQSFVVGLSGNFHPYSWKVAPEEEEAEALKYMESLPDYATMDGWVGLDPTILDEIAEFLGFNYTVLDVKIPGSNDTWTSILKEYMPQVDIMANNFALSQEREDVGFFGEKQIDISVFLVQLSHVQADAYTWQDAFRFVAPFSSGVWLAFFICMVVSALVVFVLDWSFYKQHKDDVIMKKLLDSDEATATTAATAIYSAQQQDENSDSDNSLESQVVPINNLNDIDIDNSNSRSNNSNRNSPTNSTSNRNSTNKRYSRGRVKSLSPSTSNASEGEVFPPENNNSPQMRQRPHISLFDSFYLAFASFTEAEQFQPVSKSSKIFVASWSMLTLIIVATYTANLAALLTQKVNYVEEIQSLDDAVRLGARTCVSTRNVYYPVLPSGYSSKDAISQLYPFVEVNGLWSDLYEYMKNGTCRVALFNREDISAALQDPHYCDLNVVGGTSDSDGNGFADSEIFYFSYGLVTNFDRIDLFAGLNGAVQYLLRSEIAQSLRTTWAGGVCSFNQEPMSDEVVSIQLKQLVGPFAVHFSIGMAIILYSLFKHAVIYYDLVDIKYLSMFITIDATGDDECNGNFDDDDDDDSDVDKAEQELLTTKLLLELNQRILSLENEVKHNHHATFKSIINRSESLSQSEGGFSFSSDVDEIGMSQGCKGQVMENKKQMERNNDTKVNETAASSALLLSSSSGSSEGMNENGDNDDVIIVGNELSDASLGSAGDVDLESGPYPSHVKKKTNTLGSSTDNKITHASCPNLKKTMEFKPLEPKKNKSLRSPVVFLNKYKDSTSGSENITSTQLFESMKSMRIDRCEKRKRKKARQKKMEMELLNMKKGSNNILR